MANFVTPIFSDWHTSLFILIHSLSKRTDLQFFNNCWTVYSCLDFNFYPIFYPALSINPQKIKETPHLCNQLVKGAFSDLHLLNDLWYTVVTILILFIALKRCMKLAVLTLHINDVSDRIEFSEMIDCKDFSWKVPFRDTNYVV